MKIIEINLENIVSNKFYYLLFYKLFINIYIKYDNNIYIYI